MSYREQKFLIMAAVLVVIAIASISRETADNIIFSLPTAGSSEARNSRSPMATRSKWMMAHR
jgi:hypothetical protein